MRTTNNMLISNMMYYMNNNVDRLSKYQTQMSTGKKISLPSDDPIVASRSLKYRTDVSEVAQFQKNVGDAASWMDTTESTIGQLGDILQTAHERAVQVVNGTLTNDDRLKIYKEIEQLKKQAIHLANANYAGRYIFSGYSTDTKLMNDDGTYACSVSSNKTAVIKGGILDISATNPLTIGGGNDQFQISINGAGYQNITLTNKTYDGTAGNTLDDLAADIQSKINAYTGTGLEDINVNNVDGRLEFSLKETTDANGNKRALYIGEAAANSVLSSINVKTLSTTGVIASKSEDINYQMGIGDLLNVNVLGTDIFGSGTDGDMGEFVLKFNRFLDAMSYADDKSYISSQPVDAAYATPLDFSAAGSQFSIQVDGGAASVVTISGSYDGSAGQTMTDLISDIQTQLSAISPDINVAYQNGKIVFSAAAGHQITLTAGTPSDQDALKIMKIYTNPDKTLSSVTGTEGMQNALTDMTDLLNTILSVRSDIGARMNRADLTTNRLSSDETNFTKLMSDNEDADMAEVIMNLTNEENVYKSSLSAGARIIQPSLIDFLR